MNTQLVKALDLLDNHLAGKISNSNIRGFVDEITPIYDKLTYPKKTTFYESPTLIGSVESSGAVQFERNYPELELTAVESPAELKRIYPALYRKNTEIFDKYLNEPAPVKELIRLNRAFNDYTNKPEGNRLFYNTPISEHRAKTYERRGFQSATPLDEFTLEDYQDGNYPIQYLDKRDYQGNDMLNNLYLFGDVFKYGANKASMFYNQRVPDNNLNPALDIIDQALYAKKNYHIRPSSNDMPF